MKKLISLQLIAGMLCFSICSCSLFSSSTQAVRVIASDPNAQIICNGELIGQGVAVKKLKKNKSHAFQASAPGGKKGIAVLSSELSTTGVLDIIGGCCFLLPFLGFISSGAYQLEDDAVAIQVN